MFERLRAAINAALEAATPPASLRDLTGQMHTAVVELRAAVGKMRSDLTQTEGDLAAERRQREDAARRGRLAREIRDQETVAVADRFVARHDQHIQVLEQKVQAQRAELELAERELAEMQEQLRTLDQQRGAGPGSGSAERAWRDIQNAGGTRPETDLSDELLRSQMDRATREARADEQLKELKRKMGK